MKPVADRLDLVRPESRIYARVNRLWFEKLAISKDHRGGDTFRAYYALGFAENPREFVSGFNSLKSGMLPGLCFPLPNGDGYREDFSCRTKAHIESTLKKLEVSFIDNAEPWFAQFKKPSDIRSFYRSKRFKVVDGVVPFEAQCPIAIRQYISLLQSLGFADEAFKITALRNQRMNA